MSSVLIELRSQAVQQAALARQEENNRIWQSPFLLDSSTVFNRDSSQHRFSLVVIPSTLAWNLTDLYYLTPAPLILTAGGIY